MTADADALALAAELDERADGHSRVATSGVYDAEVTAHNAAVAAALRVAAAEVRDRLVDGPADQNADAVRGP